MSSAVPALLMLHSVAINVARSEATWRSINSNRKPASRLPRPCGARNDTEVSIFTAMTQENIVHNYKDLSGFVQWQGEKLVDFIIKFSRNSHISWL